jgi:hypothetical protein
MRAAMHPVPAAPIPAVYPSCFLRGAAQHQIPVCPVESSLSQSTRKVPTKCPQSAHDAPSLFLPFSFLPSSFSPSHCPILLLFPFPPFSFSLSYTSPFPSSFSPFPCPILLLFPSSFSPSPSPTLLLSPSSFSPSPFLYFSLSPGIVHLRMGKAPAERTSQPKGPTPKKD